MDYITEQGVISPEVDNNWRIVGVDLAHESCEALIALVNKGQLASPYAKSLNVNAPTPVIGMLDNAAIYDVTGTAEEIVVEGRSYFRLRNLAVIAVGSDKPIHVDWVDGKVVIEIGAYTGAVLSLTGTATGELATMELVADGQTVTMSAVLSNGNCFVCLEDLIS